MNIYKYNKKFACGELFIKYLFYLNLLRFCFQSISVNFY